MSDMSCVLYWGGGGGVGIGVQFSDSNSPIAKVCKSPLFQARLCRVEQETRVVYTHTSQVLCLAQGLTKGVRSDTVK